MTDRALDVALAAQFGALSSTTRLALLRALRTPRALSEIAVRPAEREEGGNVARQVVRRHLDDLIEAGLVAEKPVERHGREASSFVVNHQSIYALAEELRSFAGLRPEVEPENLTSEAGLEEARPAGGPVLVLVKGVGEGEFFDLRPAGKTEWLVGRRRGLAVSLDFDPFVSSVNSRIVWEDGAHQIETLPESRNGTLVNFRALPRGRRRALRHGDLVGVGKTILAYWS